MSRVPCRRLFAILRVAFLVLAACSVLAVGWSTWSVLFRYGSGLVPRSLWFDTLIISGSRSDSLTLLEKLLPVVYAGLGFVSFQLGRLFSSLCTGNVFTMANVKRIRLAGLGFLLMSLYQLGSSWLSAKSVVDQLLASGVAASVAPVRFGFLVPAMLIFVVAEVYRFAVSVAEENRLTV
jgi:hypothetical protein